MKKILSLKNTLENESIQAFYLRQFYFKIMIIYICQEIL